MALAQRRAEDMVKRDYFSHIDPDGIWPNAHVMATGFRLPPFYSPDNNQVEALASGYRTAELALDALSLSPAHRDFMRGEGFWSDHFCFGVGYAEDLDPSHTERIYVVITAPTEKKIHTIFLPSITTGIMEPISADELRGTFEILSHV
jgi:uncharacterized protein YkwD